MNRRLVFGGVAAATLASGMSALVPRASHAAGVDAGTPPPDVANLIRRVQQSMQRHSFSGTYVVSAGGSLTSARIVHVCEGNEQIERIDALDGQMRQLFRHNETVHVFWPKAKEAVVQQRELTNDFPTPLVAITRNSLSMYDLQANGSDRVAGQEALVVTLKSKDAQRYTQRWWLAQETDLLLRADVLNERGEALESAAFSELQLGSKFTAQQLLQQMGRLDGYHVRRPVLLRTTMEREGWWLRTPVAGFEAVSTVRRPALASTSQDGLNQAAASMPASAASTPTSGRTAEAHAVIQSIFSDGLTHISLFIEPYNAELHRSEAPVVMGATHALAHRVGDWWITAVGDVPTATLKQFAQGLERRTKP